MRQPNPIPLSEISGIICRKGEEDDAAQAEALFARLLEGRRRVLGPQHPETVNTLLSLGPVRFQQRGIERLREGQLQ